MKQVYTIGHSNKDVQALIGKLQSFGIELLADVRSFPGSSRFPQFNRAALEQSLAGAGISYVHLPALGGKKQIAGGYVAYMETDTFNNELARLKDIAMQKRLAYMCAEASWRHCHRAYISERLHKEDWEVWHIADVGKVERHTGLLPPLPAQGLLFPG